ncbi:hypothetical protein J6590_060053 [Homalodisca vitripennis]|nr:hypothetical protein J6590_060053 [Homalodisca vitripennis]
MPPSRPAGYSYSFAHQAEELGMYYWNLLLKKEQLINGRPGQSLCGVGRAPVACPQPRGAPHVNGLLIVTTKTISSAAIVGCSSLGTKNSHTFEARSSIPIAPAPDRRTSSAVGIIHQVAPLYCRPDAYVNLQPPDTQSPTSNRSNIAAS